MGSLDIALWDSNARRSISLKDRLDMFAGDSGVTLIPTVQKTFIRTHDVVFLSFDECGEPVLQIARAVRKSGELTYILLINDRSCDISPLIRPKIRPGGVLFRPVQNYEIREMLDDVTSELDRIAHEKESDFFIFRAEGTTRRVLFSSILFFEASNKKVFIHTGGQEIGYYGSIESLITSLPTFFIRCHRSFIVNSQKVKEFRNTEMELVLSGGEILPFSRSYRNAIRAILCSDNT